MRMRIHFRVVVLIAALVALAGLLTLLVDDIDVFEARTGLFDRSGTWIINGIGSAIACALVALFCLRALWAGGV